MTRLRMDDRQALDTLIDAGVARSRSEALAWCVRLVAQHEAEWISELRDAMAAVEEVRNKGPKSGSASATSQSDQSANGSRAGRASGAGVPAFAMAHGHNHEIQDELREPYRALRAAIPEVMAGYATLHNAAFVEGALTVKTKELIALAIAITRECDGCVAAHAAATWPVVAPPRRRSPK